VGEGEAVLGETAEVVQDEEALMAREIDRLVGPEDVERYQETLEMAQVLLRGDLADGDEE
jgi:hypothetical protein